MAISSLLTTVRSARDTLLGHRSPAAVTDAPTIPLSPEQKQRRLNALAAKRLMEKQAEGRDIWANGTRFDNNILSLSATEKAMSDADLLASMQRYRRAALENPETVIQSASYQAGTYARSQLPEDHQRKIKQASARLTAVEKDETPQKWASDLNRSLVTDALITDRQLATKLRSYEWAMRERAEATLVKTPPSKDER